jgi:DNA-binding transcriptional MerR regulator
MSEPVVLEKYSLMVLRVTESGPATYSIEDAARLGGVHPEMLRYYCRLGLFGEERARSEAELMFDDDALYELRRFEQYRRHHGVDRKTLRLICGLQREVERLEAELRFLRGP